MHKLFLLVIIVLGIFGAGAMWQSRHVQDDTVVPTGTSLPAAQQYKDMVVVTSPLVGSAVSSPLVIEGLARGNWFFEASFPVSIVNWDGLIIGDGIAQAQGEWMTTEYVAGLFSRKTILLVCHSTMMRLSFRFSLSKLDA